MKKTKRPLNNGQDKRNLDAYHNNMILYKMSLAHPVLL